MTSFSLYPHTDFPWCVHWVWERARERDLFLF
jgi:hypothetical protein